MRLSLVLVGCALLQAQVARSAEIRVLSAGAIEPGLQAAAAAYRKETGVEIRVAFATAPQLRKRIADGEVAEVVIAPPAVIEEFSRAGKVAELRAGVGRVGLGVAVRPDAPVPDLSSTAALQRAVLEAESLVFNRASTGLYFENLLRKLGLYEQVQAKTVRYPDGASVMEHVLWGKGREIGFGPIRKSCSIATRACALSGRCRPKFRTSLRTRRRP